MIQAYSHNDVHMNNYVYKQRIHQYLIEINSKNKILKNNWYFYLDIVHVLLTMYNQIHIPLHIENYLVYFHTSLFSDMDLEDIH